LNRIAERNPTVSDIVISVEHLSKCYLVGHRRERYTALRDVIAREARNFARKGIDALRGRQIVQGDEVEEFWALKDLNFEVRRGEVVGIIGKNGAGKSTLLKILSRITEPTEGRVRLQGRVASLLEVGTGFHPELTGRENIFLNGAILGMKRSEVRRKFDEIVAFAEVERFLDTPVKHYSSGMYVRLAFAVAAHLEQEILIVDEVLAVGDADFQKKSFEKIEDVAHRQGRTVLVVSHNLAAIREMASRSLVLESGSIVFDGTVPDATARYLAKGTDATVYDADAQQNRSTPHIRKAEVLTSEANGLHRFGEPLLVKVCIRHQAPMGRGCFSFQIVNQYQQAVVHAFAYNPDVHFGERSGESTLICQFTAMRLNVGRYYLRMYLSEPPGGAVYETIDGVCQFEVVRIDKQPFWGWRPDACVYHEDYVWSAGSCQL
jgi:lipopolysaccharide transport system ATP-binding protein